jgi:3-oxoacyl-ACP reductase-like protein
VAQKTAKGDEAAAAAAAIAQFEDEFATAAAPQQRQVPAWQRAALLEGISAKETIEDLRGGSTWLS